MQKNTSSQTEEESLNREGDLRELKSKIQELQDKLKQQQHDFDGQRREMVERSKQGQASLNGELQRAIQTADLFQREKVELQRNY